MDELEQLRQRVQQLETELAEARQVQSSELYKMRAFLIPLKGFVRTLLDDEKEEWYTREDRREFYTILEENIDRLFELNLAWQGGKKEILPAGLEMYWQADVDVRKIAESVVVVHQRQTDKHTLIIDFEPSQMFVEADADKLEAVVNILVASAIKYSPDGGEVCVRARLEPPNAEWPCATLLLQVKDQGIGVNMAELKSYSKRAFISHRPKSSNPNKLGGLWQVKNFIEAHHGKTWPESEGHGKGSTFNIRIPVKQPKEQDSI